MQSRTLLVLALSLPSSGCALLGFGPPTARVEGWVYALEDQVPLPRADVCALGTDTVCIRADRAGHYSMRLTEQQVVFRFRYGPLGPAVSEPMHLVAPGRYTVNCALSNRMLVSDQPVPCQPVAGR